jgi:hypothetical protein
MQPKGGGYYTPYGMHPAAVPHGAPHGMASPDSQVEMRPLVPGQVGALVIPAGHDAPENQWNAAENRTRAAMVYGIEVLSFLYALGVFVIAFMEFFWTTDATTHMLTLPETWAVLLAFAITCSVWLFLVLFLGTQLKPRGEKHLQNWPPATQQWPVVVLGTLTAWGGFAVIAYLNSISGPAPVHYTRLFLTAQAFIVAAGAFLLRDLLTSFRCPTVLSRHPIN